MNIATYRIKINGLLIDIIQKSIKHIYLKVAEQDGRVCVAAPKKMPKKTIRLAIRHKLNWIKTQQAKLKAQPRPLPSNIISGDALYFLGQEYLLNVIEAATHSKVIIKEPNIIELHLQKKLSMQQKEALLTDWYRLQLKKLIPTLLKKWEPIIGVKVKVWHIRKMRTRWGSCNPTSAKINLNLELIKKPLPCLEYVLVHELVHLLERKHNQRFRGFMDQFFPDWRKTHKELNGVSESQQ